MLDPLNEGHIPASLAITAFQSMMNNNTEERKKEVLQQIVDSFSTIHGNGNVSMELFLRSFIKIPTNQLTNEIDMTQAMMGEFVVGVYHICGVCTQLPEKAYFMPSSFVRKKDIYRSRTRNVETPVLEYKMYDPAKFVDLRLETRYKFGDDIKLDIDTDVSRIDN